MWYWILAHVIVLLHFAFVCFVLLGGLLVVRWRWLMALHVPAVIWGVLIEYQGWLCPLTPLEQRLRQAAGQQGYSGGFIEHYLLPVLYPAGLDRHIQLVLGSLVIVINLVIYAWLIRRLLRHMGR